MPHVARFNATAGEIVMGRDNVRNDERREGRAKGGRRQSRAERDETAATRGRPRPGSAGRVNPPLSLTSQRTQPQALAIETRMAPGPLVDQTKEEGLVYWT
ncbi:hypothetical protein ACFSQQ_15705 [Mesorhizobium kowhaii]|uniref:hypothetical protein n=1 Tax=Mesorhizobium kowhaii TaxID=1300272 RepID=UPI0035E91A56